MAKVPKIPNTQWLSNEDSDATIPVVVVVGGGVVGLCTAYNLAKAVGSQQKLKIIVLEAQPSTFAAASSHNTGCLHYDFHDSFGKDITSLGKYSFELWQSIARTNTQFVSDTGYRPHSFFPIIPGEGKDEKALPNWVESNEGWNVDWGTKGVFCATVNPERVGKWLERECTAMGVEIKISTTAVATILSDCGAIQGLEFASVKTGKRCILPCQKLILTAVLPPPGEEERPDESVISDLIHYSERFIRQSGNGDGEKGPGLAVIAKGRAFRPSTVSGLPFISGIPSKYLCSFSKSPLAPSGVLICYGHGSYGITLGMGSGQLIAQLVCGQNPDIDISKFTIT